MRSTRIFINQFVVLLLVLGLVACGGQNTSSGRLENQSPIANAGPDQVIVTGAIFTLDGTASKDNDGRLSGYLWRKGDIMLSDNVVYTLDGLVDGTYSFTLVVTDNHGAISSDEVIVTVGKSVLSNQPPADNLVIG